VGPRWIAPEWTKLIWVCLRLRHYGHILLGPYQVELVDPVSGQAKST